MVPTDRKWFAHLAIAATIVERLERLDLHSPKVEGRALAEMRKVRKALMAERPGQRQTPIGKRSAQLQPRAALRMSC